MNAIELLKNQKRPELLYLLMRDVEAKRVLVAWTIYGHVDPKRNDIDDDSQFEKMVEATWFQTTSVNPHRLANLAGLSVGMAEKKHDLLKELGLIYPDGTASDDAVKIIRAEVEAQLASIASR